MKSTFSSVIVSIVICALAGCQGPANHGESKAPSLSRFEYSAPKMGTIFGLTLYASDKGAADRAAAACWARVDQLEQTLSDWRPSSEISLLSQQTLNGPMAAPVPVSEDLYYMLERSLEAARLSDGDFDITVGPLVRLWRRSQQLVQLPKPSRIEAAKRSVGYRFIKLDPAHRSVQLLAPRMVLDVGGIAKGYTSMQVLKLLRERFGITRALCGAAGDIHAGDPPPGKSGWVVRLESLEDKSKPGVYVRLHNYGISTSGDTERFVIIDGVRYSHIISPKTGLGLTDRIAVTVIAPDSTTTDWMSTAVSVMGPEKGLALVEQTPGAAARITKIEGGRIAVWESKRFGQFAFQPAP
ncbi:MAG TPA: FAD:protein FMN transferase [Tepidisphaeraceae bacterium]|nr:FAD:protein FMN transferase [Tepidisphaeraceae bacterium]